MSNICSIIGDNIRRYRHKRGYTQEKLAIRAKVGEYYLGRVELGKENISAKTLQKIATALEVETYQLLKPKK
ncbi:MAG: helix-turn-helix domain-containing protein [Gloeomargaritales cyanobacterium]